MITRKLVVVGLAQASEYIVPILAIPILIKYLGMSGYGKFALAQSLGYILIVICDYGFNLSAARKVAVSRNNIISLSKISAAIQSAKIILLASLVIITLGIVFGVNNLNNYREIIFVAFILPVGSVLNPHWLMIGLDKVAIVSVAMLICRGISLLLLTIFIPNNNDIQLACGIMFSPPIIVGISIWVYLRIVDGLRIEKLNFLNGVNELAEAKETFMATSVSSLFRLSNPLILGAVSDAVHVAIYSLAEKIVKIAQEAIKPIVLTRYAKLSIIAADGDSDEIGKYITNTLKLAFIISIAVAMSCVIMVYPVVEYVGVDDKENALKYAIFIMTPAILFGAGSMILGAFALVPLKHEKALLKAILITGLINAILSPVLCYTYDSKGAAISFLLSELILLMLLVNFHRVTFFKKRK